jgi:hypothetical protein
MHQTHSELALRKSAIEERIRTACQRAGRQPEEITLIAVTKYSTLAATEEIVQLGATNLGESRWQEARHKWEVIGDRVTWHFIGHLQTNKVKDVIGKFSVIHSLDRISLAAELERKAAQMAINVDCFVQINISGEQSKYGLQPSEVPHFFEQMRDYPHLHVKGLMTMAPYDAPDAEVRSIFRGLREWRERINEQRWTDKPLHHLSMGMSDDFEIAIEEGATMIRLGSILMGK